MLIDWSRFLPALLILLPPIALFHGRRVRYRPLAHGWSGYWTRTFSLGLHLIDFGRAILGAWWLAESFPVRPEMSDAALRLPALVSVIVLGTAVLLQTFVCREPGAAHAPLVFVAGLAAGFLPPLITAFALLLAIVIATGTRSAAGFFPALSFTVLAAGLLFTRAKLVLPLMVVAIASSLPWLAILLFPRPLVLSYLAKLSTSRSAAATHKADRSD